MNDDAAFARAVGALRPWREQVVVVGGWAHRLYRLHQLANSPAYQALLTRDVDIAFGEREPLEGSIGKALQAAGFAEELTTDHQPPVTQYHLRDDDLGFYVEFLTPLTGSGVRRDGTPDATIRRAGVSAQKLRHLDLLLRDPWAVSVPDVLGRTEERILIANPVSFIAQKLLIAEARPPRKRAQDLLYIHDTLELFGGKFDVLKSQWNDRISRMLSRDKARTVEGKATTGFDQISDTVREAARIPADRPQLSPERLRRGLADGLAVVFSAKNDRMSADS